MAVSGFQGCRFQRVLQDSDAAGKGPGCCQQVLPLRLDQGQVVMHLLRQARVVLFLEAAQPFFQRGLGLRELSLVL